MKKKILITSALPYANGPLHLGHIAGAYLPADVYARFQRLRNREVLYVCGSDEYGVAVALSAQMEGRTPREQVDLYHRSFQEFFGHLQISFDHYSRTTHLRHRKRAQQFFLDLLKAGYIEERVTEQLYSTEENLFLADRYVIGECPKCGYEAARGDECPYCAAYYEATELRHPRSKLSEKPLQKRETHHWYLLFDRLQEPLRKWLATKEEWKPNVLQFARNFLEELRPRAITRDASWGIPVPLEQAQGKVLYVWFEAPIGYISATEEWAEQQGKPESWKEYWLNPDCSLVQFIGKDNIPFHALFFPAMILGQKQPYTLVDQLPANEFYLLEGRQFSKSEGWYLDMKTLFARYTVDSIRYAIATTAPENGDSEFSWREFQRRINGDLVGTYGNFFHRVIQFAHKYCGGVIQPLTWQGEEEKRFLQEIETIQIACQKEYENFSLRGAAGQIMRLARSGNIYFDRKKVWQLRKREENRKEMESTLSCCWICMHTLALISSPLLPESARKIYSLLGEHPPPSSPTWPDSIQIDLREERKLGVPTPLFCPIQEEEIIREERELQERSSG